MYLCYVDESGDVGEKGSKHLVLTAAVLFEGKWSYLKKEIEDLLDQTFAGAAKKPAELHCADIRSGRGPYRTMRKTDRMNLLGEFGRIANSYLESELRFFTIVVDKATWWTRHPGLDGRALYRDAFENLVSRIDLFLRRRAAEGKPSKGIVIIDANKSTGSTHLRSAMGVFHDIGTQWARLHNVIETVMFLDSHESPGLQLADLASYAVWRVVEHGDARLADQLGALFDREPLHASVTPGKWHGVKYVGADAAVSARIRHIWPPPT